MISARTYESSDFEYSLSVERAALSLIENEEEKKEIESNFTKFVFKRASFEEYAALCDYVFNNKDAELVGLKASLFIISVLLKSIRNFDGKEEVLPEYNRKKTISGYYILSDEFIKSIGHEYIRELGVHAFNRCMISAEEKKN